MDTPMPDREEGGEPDNAARLDQEPSVASIAPPPSSSALSDAPESDRKETDSSENIVVAVPSTFTQPPSQTEAATANGVQFQQQAQSQAGPLEGMGASISGEAPSMAMHDPQAVSTTTTTPSQFPTQAVPPTRGTPRGRPPGRPPGRGRGRGTNRSSLGANGTTASDGTIIKPEGDASSSTPGSGGRPRGVGRGRGGGRPRGSRARGGGRGGKRKRNDDDEDEISSLSDSSDEVTPIATMTKSGRNVQKPTSFVPPPASPSTAGPAKRKRPYTHRNPQAAVCKVCLRGTSPTSNPVVFCDGCNAPYHRWCHKPPIEQAVIDEEDKQWYCRMCEEERVVPVPEAEVAQFVGVPEGASEEQRRKYFSSLPQGVLVTLLVKASTVRPDLPLFDPSFKPAVANGEGSSGKAAAMQPPPQPRFNGLMSTKPQSAADDAAYTPEVHPENYPRPGQGLMSTLPPDQADLEYLVDEEDKYGVFTHIYQAAHAPGPAPSAGPPPAPAPMHSGIGSGHA